MKIYHDSKLLQYLSNSFIFIDTNVLIGAIKHELLFGKLLNDLKRTECSFITINSVVFEFVRGTESAEDLNKRYDFVKEMCAIYPIERHEEDIKGAVLSFKSLGKSMSYTDFLLCVCLKKLKGAFLMTSDLKDIPLKFFERVEVITIDTDSEVRNYGIYRLR